MSHNEGLWYLVSNEVSLFVAELGQIHQQLCPEDLNLFIIFNDKSLKHKTFW